MNGWESFSKYLGVQGILALALGGGYIYAALAMIPLPEGYTELLSLVVGFYFAKNGGNLLRKVTGG